MSEKDSPEELEKAFVLFSKGSPNAVISFEDLKAVADELGETMSDDELREMIIEANNKKDRGKGEVTKQEFMSILNKAAQNE